MLYDVCYYIACVIYALKIYKEGDYALNHERNFNSNEFMQNI